MQRGNKDVT